MNHPTTITTPSLASPAPDSGLRRAALEKLRSVFGYRAFRGAQGEIVEHVCLGGDALVLMPTGGGKSMCYQLPALLRPGCGIVVSPLIALMQDQVDALQQAGVACAFLNSSLDFAQVVATQQQLERGALDLLYVAPERLLNERFLGQLARLYEGGRLALFAIDEAHCVSQWGHDFRPEYMQLSILHERFPNVPRVALTATADALTRAEIVRRLKLEEARVFVSSFDRPNIRYRVVERDNPRAQLLDFLGEHRGDCGIVYCLSRSKVEDTAAWLRQQGFEALPYHAGLDAPTRRTHQQRFVREDGIVMVATIAFGMGIDKPDVRFVAHLDLPKSLEAYYQETGRAGRDGEPAQAWLSYAVNDIIIHRARIDESNASDEQKRIERQKLDAMLGFCEAATCRRMVLLSYFGESPAAPCGNCDTCLEPPTLWDGTVAAQKLLSAALRTGQRFGAAHLIDVLLGRRSEKMVQHAHDQLPTFGVGKELDERGWRSVVRQMIAAGLLVSDAEAYGALKLNGEVRSVLKGERTLMLRQQAARPPRGGRKRLGRGAAAVGAGQGGGRSSVALVQPDGQQDAAQVAALVERLRQWRLEISREQGVPAYVILHDRTLLELASRRPQNEAELLGVIGIGEAKARRYGEALLRLLAVEGG